MQSNRIIIIAINDISQSMLLAHSHIHFVSMTNIRNKSFRTVFKFINNWRKTQDILPLSIQSIMKSSKLCAVFVFGNKLFKSSSTNEENDFERYPTKMMMVSTNKT